MAICVNINGEKWPVFFFNPTNAVNIKYYSNLTHYIIPYLAEMVAVCSGHIYKYSLMCIITFAPMQCAYTLHDTFSVMKIMTIEINLSGVVICMFMRRLDHRRVFFFFSFWFQFCIYSCVTPHRTFNIYFIVFVVGFVLCVIRLS